MRLTEFLKHENLNIDRQVNLRLVEHDRLQNGNNNFDVDLDADGDRVHMQVLQNGMEVAELTYEDGEVVWIHVEPFFRKQKLGTAMVKYLQDKGYRVVMPDARTDDGKGFFGKMQQQGNLDEDLFKVDGDALGTDGKITISASPVAKHEVRKMQALGQGLRILVGADNMRQMLVVWAGDGDSNIGATHETIADQFGMSMHNERHVPLELTKAGQLRVTTTAQGQFDDPRDVEDVLDRNPEYRQIFGGMNVDMSKLEAW